MEKLLNILKKRQNELYDILSKLIKIDSQNFGCKGNEKENPLMEKLISKAAEVSGRTLKPCGSCQSDLSLFIKNGSKRAFSFGIGRDFGAYGGAHQADEYIECEKLLEFAEIIASTLI